MAKWTSQKPKVCAHAQGPPGLRDFHPKTLSFVLLHVAWLFSLLGTWFYVLLCNISEQLCCDSVACCVTLLFKLLSCLSCFVPEVLYILVLYYMTRVKNLDSIASCFFTSVVVGDVSVDLILKC